MSTRGMNVLAHLVLFGWPFVTLLFFFFLQPRRAVLASMILGWLFLPVATYKFGEGIPIISKLMVVSWSTLLGAAIFDGRRLRMFQPGWVDLPMLVWCLCPMAASLSNDLGFHDGISSVLYKTSFWGVPYLLGRLYCSNLLGMRELATAIFFGGILYAPFCLLEVRMSPQLHRWVYGFHQHDWVQTIRYGGYRPMVFMNHGIMLSTWMAMSVLAGLSLWWGGILREVGRIKVPWILAGLLVTTILCKSIGAILLMVVGAGVLWICRVAPSRALLLTLGLLPLLFLAVRITRIYSAKDLSETAPAMDEDRAASIKFRMLNEDFLVDKAFRRPYFGWGLWGRARIHDALGHDITVTDSLWIIELGNEGTLGLACMLMVFLMPLYGLFRVLPNPATWKSRFAYPSVFCCVMVLSFFIDCLFNDMNNPAYIMAVGGLSFLRIGLIRKRPPPPVAVEGMTWAPRS